MMRSENIHTRRPRTVAPLVRNVPNRVISGGTRMLISGCQQTEVAAGGHRVSVMPPEGPQHHGRTERRCAVHFARVTLYVL